MAPTKQRQSKPSLLDRAKELPRRKRGAKSFVDRLQADLRDELKETAVAYYEGKIVCSVEAVRLLVKTEMEARGLEFEVDDSHFANKFRSLAR